MANSRESKLTCISGGTLDGLLRAAEIFKRNGRYRVSMRQNRANPGVRDHANTMNNVLKTVSGCARSKIHPRCKELIKDLRQVKWLSCGGAYLHHVSEHRRGLSGAEESVRTVTGTRLAAVIALAPSRSSFHAARAVSER